MTYAENNRGCRINWRGMADLSSFHQVQNALRVANRGRLPNPEVPLERAFEWDLRVVAEHIIPVRQESLDLRVALRHELDDQTRPEPVQQLRDARKGHVVA